MIEDIHANMGGHDLLDLKPVILPRDKGALLARQLVARLLADEASAPRLDASPPSKPPKFSAHPRESGDPGFFLLRVRVRDSRVHEPHEKHELRGWPAEFVFFVWFVDS